MPRGRKPKVDLLLAPKEEAKKVKSPWDKTKESIEEKTEVEFSQAVIDKNRKRINKELAIVKKGQAHENELTVEDLRIILKNEEGDVIYQEFGPNIKLMIYKVETDEEVISRLRQKKLELEKLKEELSEES